MARYFFSTIASRPMQISGRTIKWTVCSVSGGRANGIFEAIDPSDIAVLDDAVRGRRGVQEISQVEFEKKNAPVTQTRSRESLTGSPRLVRPSVTPPLSVDGKVGRVQSAVITEPTPAKTDQFQGETHTTPSIASLMKVKRLNPPKPFAASEGKTKKASERADRAKVRMVRASVNTP